MADTAAPAIRLRGLNRTFGDVVAVDDLDLDIPEGEFFSMLGPSGSGKTTVLRLIAGFDAPSSGTIELFGEEVTRLAAFDRDVNTVFQDYALFPHMNVQQNVEFGLRVRKVAPAERRRLAGEMLERMRLGQHSKRRPHELSGGQRQRVALARSLVVRPRALLLDEPLGALDLKLREQMQVELKELQRELGITFIFVTHDQEEALTLSDRIAVFRDGRIEQVGMARELYERPATPFVASFLGTSNLIEGELAQRLVGRPGRFSVRPERLIVGDERAEGLPGTVAETIYLGSAMRLVIDLDEGGRVTALEQIGAGASHEAAEARGDRVRVCVDPADAVELAEEPAAAVAA